MLYSSGAENVSLQQNYEVNERQKLRRVFLKEPINVHTVWPVFSPRPRLNRKLNLSECRKKLYIEKMMGNIILCVVSFDLLFMAPLYFAGLLQARHFR